MQQCCDIHIRQSFKIFLLLLLEKLLTLHGLSCPLQYQKVQKRHIYVNLSHIRVYKLKVPRHVLNAFVNSTY